MTQIEKRAFWLIFGMATGYLLPIILANISYADDFFRTYHGRTGWAADGRIFADIFYVLFSLSDWLLDLYPLPLLTAVMVYAAIGAKLATSWRIPPARFALCYILLLINPFFLQNLFFRYDSAFMLLALAFATAPFAIHASTGVVGFLGGIVFLLLGLTSFQSGATLFIGITGAEILVRHLQGKNFNALATTTLAGC